jgi:hypothetical protein
VRRLPQGLKGEKVRVAKLTPEGGQELARKAVLAKAAVAASSEARLAALFAYTAPKCYTPGAEAGGILLIALEALKRSIGRRVNRSSSYSTELFKKNPAEKPQGEETCVAFALDDLGASSPESSHQRVNRPRSGTRALCHFRQ